MKNIEKLIRMPDGCGEQNMLNFVPNIVVLDYLRLTNQLSPAIETKAKQFLDAGYQRELSYKHDDGSFSAFGKRDKNGSTWLTAFVVRSFIQASQYIQVEQRIINEALDWLSRVQAPNGSFPEYGSVFSTEMQGESGKGKREIQLLHMKCRNFTNVLLCDYRHCVNCIRPYCIPRGQSKFKI